MTDIETLVHIKDDSQLLKEFKSYKEEIGMVVFLEKEDIIPLSKEYIKIGNFELDILAMRKSNNEIVMLDHDSPDFEIGNCAKDIRCFLMALNGFIGFMKTCEENEELYDDFDQMEVVAKESSVKAGGDKYLWFYKMMYGI